MSVREGARQSQEPRSSGAEAVASPHTPLFNARYAKKVKLSTVLDQTEETEVPELAPDAYDLLIKEPPARWMLQGGHRPRPSGLHRLGSLLACLQGRASVPEVPSRSGGQVEQYQFPLNLEFLPVQPWIGVFTAAARDSEYWQKEVRRPAIEFIARGIRGSVGSSAQCTYSHGRRTCIGARSHSIWRRPIIECRQW